MDQQYDPENVFTRMHHRVTGELLRLLDGLYSNIEDSLFELATRARTESQQRHCFELMRELRYRRSRATQQFARGMQGSLQLWFAGGPETEEVTQTHHEMARRMSEKCSAHFANLLQTLAERTADATGREFETAALPIGPYQIARKFIQSMSALEFDDTAIEVVQHLFSRFVLDRLGPIYGECNHELDRAGFLTARDLANAADARA